MHRFFELNQESKIIFETPDDGYSYFFGYYDKSPLDISNHYLLCHRVGFDGRDIRADDSADVGFWDIEEAVFHRVGRTRAFNWQQGSHLQWLPPDFKSRIIYNDRRNGKFVSIICNLETSQETIYPFPIYTVHPSGKFALAVNYERLYFCRPGYNYMGVANEKWNVPIHEEDGIFRVDFETGKVSLLLRTREVVNFAPKPELEKCDNWLEHMMWNKTGSRFAFLHRWEIEDGLHKTRLFTANEHGEDLFMLPDLGFYSHMGWKNDNEFTIWSQIPSQKTNVINFFASSSGRIFSVANFFLKVLRSVLGEKRAAQITSRDSYITYRDRSNKFTILDREVLPSNGHNTWSRDERYMLSDTYNDENNYRHLVIFDEKNNSVERIGKFYSTYNNSGYRADLHPRFSHDENMIVIDSAHRKNRGMIIIKRPKEGNGGRSYGNL